MLIDRPELVKRIVGCLLIAIFGVLPFAVFYSRYLNDDTELAPHRGLPRYIKSSQEVILYDNLQNPILILAPKAKVYLLEPGMAKAHIEIYGWIWSSSITQRGTNAILVPELNQENFRTQEQGEVIAKVLKTATLEPRTPKESMNWTFCRVAGWVNSSVLSEHSDFGIPVITITTKRGGDSVATTTITESMLVLVCVVFLTLCLGLRLLMPGELFGTEIAQQHPNGSGDNVSLREDKKMAIDSSFKIATKIANPLSLAGVTIIAVYLLLRGVLELGIFPKLTEQHGFILLADFIHIAFYLGVIALVFGLGTHLLTNLKQRQTQRDGENPVLQQRKNRK